MLDAQVPMTVGDLLRWGAFLLSFLGNLFLLYRHKTASHTIYNGIVGLFNSIGWQLAREVTKVRTLDARISNTANDEVKAALQAFRDYAEESNLKLRALHEQLVAIAKTVQSKDKRWEGDKFGLGEEELQELRRRAAGG